jgi:GR25 family glycosyltransferase involved in LPS biosynthesis
MESWLEQSGVPETIVERIDAVYRPDKGYIGCTESHIKTLETFIASEHKVCCIFEDDFTPVRSNLFLMQLALPFVNKVEFDLIQLAYGFMKSTETEYPFLLNPTHARTTSGYMITREFAPKLLENFKEGLRLALECEENGEKNANYCCDMYWDKLMPESKWYLLKPRVGKQIDSYSDIEYRDTRYGV